MSSALTFEDLDVWKEARALVSAVYTATRRGDWSKDYGLKDQIQRAAVSILSNIAEGSDRESSKDYARFIAIAKGSAAEVRAQLYVALDLKYIEPADFKTLSDQTVHIGRMLGSLYNYLSSLSKAESAASQPKTQNPKPKTQNPKPKTQNPKPKTRNL